MKTANLIDALGLMDDSMLREVELLRSGQTLALNHQASALNRQTSAPNHGKSWRKLLLPLATSLLIAVGGITAYGINVFHWNFTQTKGDSLSDQTQGFQVTLDDAVSKVKLKEIKGEVRKASDAIVKQFANHKSYDSWFPGHYRQTFSSIEEATAYIGYEGLRLPEPSLSPNLVEVNVQGDKDGKLQRISLDASNLSPTRHYHYTSSAILFTENDPSEAGIRAIVGDYAGLNVTTRTETVGGREFLIISVSQNPNEYAFQEILWQENKVLYFLHVNYAEDAEDEAQKIMQEWMNGFK